MEKWNPIWAKRFCSKLYYKLIQEETDRNIKKLSPYNELDEAGAESADSQPDLWMKWSFKKRMNRILKIAETMKSWATDKEKPSTWDFLEGMEYEQIYKVMDPQIPVSKESGFYWVIVKLKEIIVFCLIFF